VKTLKKPQHQSPSSGDVLNTKNSSDQISTTKKQIHHSTNNNQPSSQIVSNDLKCLINPLISLLTTVINKLILKNDYYVVCISTNLHSPMELKWRDQIKENKDSTS